MNNKVSILITTFNRADKVVKALDTALNQTYKCEVVVVDHGSTDKTQEVVQKYGDKIKYVRKDEDFGPHFSWLDGILHCSGDFIHIQHDDDWISPDFIEKCMNLMNDEVGCVFSDSEIVFLGTEKTKTQYNLNKKKYGTGIYNRNILEKKLMKSNVISPSCVLYRKEDMIDGLILGKIPLKNNQTYHGVGSDIFMMLVSLLRYKKFGYINESLAYFGAHDGSITIDSSKDSEKTRRINEAYDIIKAYYLGLKHIQKNLSLYKRRASLKRYGFRKIFKKIRRVLFFKKIK